MPRPRPSVTRAAPMAARIEEVRSALLGLLRLLATETARRLVAQDEARAAASPETLAAHTARDQPAAGRVRAGRNRER